MIVPKSAIRPTLVAKGLLTYVLPQAALARSTGGYTLSARYCYSVFLRHRLLLAAAGLDAPPDSVAELGPGESLGVGIAALIAGASRYRALDAKPYAGVEANLKVFDELVALFRSRAPLPGNDEFPEIKPAVPPGGGPADLFDRERLDAALADDRLRVIRQAVAEPGSRPDILSYVAPWDAPDLVKADSVDWLFSQAVLQYVDDLPAAYRTFASWLRPGGVMTHQIDLRSHNTSPWWNGHYSYPEPVWRIARGARPYFLNREPYSAHIQALKAAGFDSVAEHTVRLPGGLPRHRLAGRFRTGLTDTDLHVSGLFLIARKKGHAPQA
ncbi:hypothetical protein [Azospirillum sp. sgz302134]